MKPTPNWCGLCLPCRLQHILDKDPVPPCGVIHQYMGDRADEFAVLNNGTSTHERLSLGTTVLAITRKYRICRKPSLNILFRRANSEPCYAEAKSMCFGMTTDENLQAC